MASYSTLPDQELANLFKDGDEYAYAEIFNRYNALLLMHAYRKLQNKEEAKDVVQEVFAMLWSIRTTFVLKTNLAGFLYTCIHYKILDKIVHEKTETKYHHFLQQLSIEVKEADYQVRERQLADIIENEIDDLPDKMKNVFKLSRYKHLSHKEIASELHISEETVKKQIKNAIKILKIKLDLFIWGLLLLMALFFS
ncbi:RNA polymerase sigma factor [Mucilaginibacter paludis]|uniref:RNA polymerase, sigma-24 subunit, ECF subfamily n=1 Tax=Mucilaginibacter paludis DSM 18603 TaxID=714943 RepID=H1YE30_9SPHI|nr:RNA polymerase sigma-70 factor [Mucilaginibacter paludis]EHQ25208.1 RNA polymerase, sigma-24 subunit, ECF subfamily [Mucilaginibacter paludis DSM 18603]